MLDGATFWYKGEGHGVRMKGPTDLVFILRQTPHPRFERVGDGAPSPSLHSLPPHPITTTVLTVAPATTAAAVTTVAALTVVTVPAANAAIHTDCLDSWVALADLWYYVSTPTRAEDLLFCRLVPTITGGSVLATGSTLRVLLGFDKSAMGEAIVGGHGMPLRADATEATLPARPAQRQAGLSLAPSAAPPTRVAGDLIVKFAVTPPVRQRRVVVGRAGLCAPPITLLTSAGGPLPQRTLPPTALEAVALHSWLPALLQLYWRRRNQPACDSQTQPACDSQKRAPSTESCLRVPLHAVTHRTRPPPVESQRISDALAVPDADTPPTAAQVALACTVAAAGSGNASAGSGNASAASGNVTAASVGVRRPSLHAIYLRVGAADIVPPSGAAAQLMRLMRHVLPEMTWREVHVTTGT